MIGAGVVASAAKSPIFLPSVNFSGGFARDSIKRNFITTPKTSRRSKKIRFSSDNIEFKVAPPAVIRTSHGRRRFGSFFLPSSRHAEPFYQVNYSSLRREVENGKYINEMCMICKCKLGSENIVLLSCGHVLHHSCLKSFRKLSRLSVHTCPKCRQPYSIAEIDIDIEELNKCAKTIQRVFRGYIIRREMDKYVPPGSLLHRKWLALHTQTASQKLTSVIDQQNDSVDLILSTIDHQLEWARSIMKAAEVRGTDYDWNSVRKKVRTRQAPCSICIRPIFDIECAITSCCHSFHLQCLKSWMQYCQTGGVQPSCPECRSMFQYRLLIDNSVSSLQLQW